MASLKPLLFLVLLPVCWGALQLGPKPSWDRALFEEQTDRAHRLRAPPPPLAICPTFPVLGHIPRNYAPLQALLAEFAANVTEIVEEYQVPGVTVNLVYDQKIIFSQGWGSKNISDPSAPAPGGNDKYRIGSVSKMFSILLALIARDDGILNLEDPVSQFEPRFHPINPFPTTQNITFEHLAAHMSGLQRTSPCKSLEGECNLSNAVMWERVSKTMLVNPIGTRPAYSNLGFAVLGHVMGEIYGESWEKAVKEKILEPLGMRHSGPKIDNKFLSDYTVGYTAGPNDTLVPAPLTDIGWESPAGGVYSTANDLSKFLKLVFRDNLPYKANPDQILDATTIRDWLQARYIDTDTTGYGVTWEILNSPYQFSKQGAIFGYLSEIAFIPQIKFGIVALTSYDKYLEPLTEIISDWGNDLIPRFTDILRDVAPAPFIPANFSYYVGDYALTESPDNPIFEINIKTVDNHPTIILTYIGVADIPLMHVHGNVYRMLTEIDGSTLNCLYAEDGLGNYVHFHHTNPPTFTIPGLLYAETLQKIE